MHHFSHNEVVKVYLKNTALSTGAVIFNIDWKTTGDKATRILNPAWRFLMVDATEYYARRVYLNLE